MLLFMLVVVCLCCLFFVPNFVVGATSIFARLSLLWYIPHRCLPIKKLVRACLDEANQVNFFFLGIILVVLYILPNWRMHAWPSVVVILPSRILHALQCNKR